MDLSICNGKIKVPTETFEMNIAAYSSSVFVQSGQCVITAGFVEHPDSCRIANRFVSKWLDTLTLLFTITLCNNCYTNCITSLVRDILPLYYRFRNKASFWTLPQSHLNLPLQTIRPHVPVDCKGQKNFYIKTLSGFVCWDDSWETPINIDFYYYLYQTASMLTKIHEGKAALDSKDTAELESFSKVLSLL